MAETDTAKTTHPLLKKLDELTYGLIYPAFLGAMIYDIAQGIAEKGQLRGTALVICFMIVILNALDYMHLFADMKEVVKVRFHHFKGPVYIFCDIAGSCCFFISFLLIKYQHSFWAMILIGVVPGLTAIYKQTYAVSDKDRRFATRYGIAFGLLTALGACIFSCDCMILPFLVFFVGLEVLVYFFYIFFLFPLYKSKNPDEGY